VLRQNLQVLFADSVFTQLRRATVSEVVTVSWLLVSQEQQTQLAVAVMWRHPLAGTRRRRSAIPTATTKHCAILKHTASDSSDVQKNVTASCDHRMWPSRDRSKEPGTLKDSCAFMTWAFSAVKGVRLHAQSLDVSCLKLQ